MAIGIEPLTRHIGAEITGVDLSQPVDGETAAALNRAWLDNVVIVFRGQRLSQQDLLRVTSCFGILAGIARPKEFRPPGHDVMLDGIMLISNIRENGKPIGALPDGEMMFHHDMIHAPLPDKGTCLYSVEVPSTGGNTLFANCYTAYERLPRELREPLEGRRALHHYNYGTVVKGDGKGIAAFAECTHPVFRTHDETGRKAVYVNRLMTEYVLDMERAESDRLLARLFDHAENREWVYAHEWRPGDLVIWDNRCSMHARTDFPGAERRLLWRTTMRGAPPPA